MASPLVLDTDLLIDFLRNTQPNADRVRELGKVWRILVSAVTAYELRVGFTDEEEQALRADIQRRTVALDLDAAIVAGRIGRALRTGGNPIGTSDELIAGTCVRFGLPLATRNRRHFERVPGLELIEV